MKDFGIIAQKVEHYKSQLTNKLEEASSILEQSVNGGVKFGSFFVKKLRIVTLSDGSYLSPFTDLAA